MEQKKKFVIGDMIDRDTNAITKKAADLTAFTAALNNQFKQLAEIGYIDREDITPEMVAGLAVFDAAHIIEAVTRKYQQDAEIISFKAARNKFLAGLAEAVEDIKEKTKEFAETTDREKLKRGYYFETPDMRLPYLTLSGHTVSFDRNKLTEDHTRQIPTQEIADLLNRAADLFEQLQQLNEETRRRSGGSATGIAEPSQTAFISVSDIGEIFFNKDAAAMLNF